MRKGGAAFQASGRGRSPRELPPTPNPCYYNPKPTPINPMVDLGDAGDTTPVTMVFKFLTPNSEEPNKNNGVD